MNKPPGIKDTYIFDELLQDWRSATKAEKQMCEDMKRPMTQKTENLTTEEAWAAMVRGECVKTNCHIHTIRGGTLQWWSSEWISTPHLEAGPYSIVPDPSKPKEVDKSEYERDRKNLITHLDTATWKYSERPGHMTDMIFDLIEKYYQRKP